MANGENLGSINYSVDVDYSALIAAGQAQDQFTQKARDTASELTKYKYVTSTVTKEYRALKASIDPAYKAQQQFAAGADLIQKELNSGRITLSQYSKDMANLRATTTATARIGGRFGNVVGGMGGAVQQAGYQIGDFATQIASGQSALVAFTQQGAQMAGIFGPGGAVLGAVLAIGGAIGGYFVRSMGEGEESVKTFREQLEELNAEFRDLTANQKAALELELAAELEKTNKKLEDQNEKLRDLQATRENLLRLQEMAENDPDMVFNEGQLDAVNKSIIELKGSIDNTELSAKRTKEEFEGMLSGITSDADKLIASLEDEYLALSMTDRMLVQHRLNVAGATDDQRERALALYDEAEALREKARNEEAAATAAENAAARARKAWEDQQKAAESANKLLNQILGVSDAQKFADQWAKISEGVAAGFISEEDAKKAMDVLISASEDAGKDAAEEFVNPWQKAADNVANSLQDAIASGDWDKIGDAIGNSLATSIAGIVNKTITDSLAKDLTANSSALAQIGGAFAGPIAGAVAGGAIQLAVSELSDFFSGSDWDPTEARQAAQGTGTVLGSIDAKSESIAKAVDVSAGASRELVGINRDMLRALQTLQLGIAGASGMVARSYGGLSMPADFTRTISGSDFDLTGGIMPIFDETLGAAFDFFDGAFDVFSFGTFDLGGALGSVFGGSTKVKDIGIQFFGATLDEMIRGWRDGDNYYTAQAYASIKKDGGWFSSDKRWDEYQRLGTDAENQISLVFMGIRDSVTAGAEALGMSGTEIQSALDTFRVETQKISLEGLSAEEQTAELEAVFSSIFDQAAAAVVPYLDDFQRAGEGLGETLARVATQVQVTEQAVDMLGLRFSDLAGAELIEASDRLIELNGGLDQFISSMQNFIGNFATESQQFEINANALASGMGDLPLPETRDGFWALMQAQDAATEEGAENIATLLRLQGVADAYYSAIEKAQESYYQTEIAGQRDRLSEAQRANRAVQSAMDSMLFQSSAVQEASRQGALRTLEQIANAGRVTDIGQLQSALDAATQLDTGNYSTFADYAREFARTSGVVGRVGDVTQQAEDREARMLRSLENQLEAVKGLRDDLERSQLALIKQANKTAKTLERFEIDGIEVRA